MMREINETVNQNILDYLRAKKEGNSLLLLNILNSHELFWNEKGFIEGIKSIERYLVTGNVFYLSTLSEKVLFSEYFTGGFDKIEYSSILIFYYERHNDFEMILNYFSMLDVEVYSIAVLKKVCLAYYKNKKFSSCIDVGLVILEKEEDFFIYELLAESNLMLNQLNKSYKYFGLALRLNSKLISAKFKYVILKAQLDLYITDEQVNEIEAIALKRGNVEWIRDVAYIQFKRKDYNQTIKNLGEIEGKNKLISLDYLTLSECFEILSKSKEQEFNLNMAKVNSFEFIFESSSHEKLLVSFSSNHDFVLRKYKYKADRLYVLDSSLTYYLYSAEYIANKIIDLCLTNNYKEISLVGLSKGGCGALLVSIYLKKAIAGIDIKVVLFSTQFQLWPLNTNLLIPTYRVFYKHASLNPIAFKILSNHGRFSELETNFDGYRVSCFYGDKYKMDVNEAGKMKGKENFHFVELDYSGHATGIPLTIPEGRTYENLKEKYSTLKIDADFKALGGGEVSCILDEIYKIYLNPKMRLSNFI